MFIFPWHWLDGANSVSRVLLHLTHSMFRLIGFVCVCVHLPSVSLNILACLTEKNKTFGEWHHFCCSRSIEHYTASDINVTIKQGRELNRGLTELCSGWETALHVIEAIKEAQAASDGMLEYCLPRRDIRRTGNTTTQQVSQRHLL